MKIVIDMQGAQSIASKNRGVGRYTKELTMSLIKQCREQDEIFLVLNAALKESCDELIALYEGLIGRDHIKTWKWGAHIPVGNGRTEEKIIKAEELFYEWFFQQFDADIIWRPNLQEGLNEENIIISAGKIRGKARVCTTLHDVIPLLYREDYLLPGIEKWYLSKIRYAKESDSIITDSYFSKNAIKDYLDVEEEKIIPIHLGFDKHRFYPNPKHMEWKEKTKIILYAGGTDKHKNLENLIAAFGRLPEKIQKEYRIVFAGKEPYIEKEKLYAMAKKHYVSPEKLEFTGYISDEKLLSMMQTCGVFVFPSISEGFGLPLLEAMACGAPVLAARAASLTEIVDDEDLLFDPFSVKDMADKIELILSNPDFVNRKIKSLLKRTEFFSWEKAGQELYNHFKEQTKLCEKDAEVYTADQLVKDIALLCAKQDYLYKANIACAVANCTMAQAKKHLYIDCSAVVLEDYVTGIQRVVNAMIENAKEIAKEYPNICVEPVYSSVDKAVFYKAEYNGKKYTSNKYETNNNVVAFHDGDYLLMPDLHPVNVISKVEYLKDLNRRGIKVYTVLHDLIPVQHPGFYDRNFVREFENYLYAISEFTGVISVSKATQDAYEEWMRKNNIKRNLKLDYSHHGSDIVKANPSKGLPDGYEEIVDKLSRKLTFLMVSTIEPRKKQDEILDAIESLWEMGKDVNLCLIGRNGWQMEDFAKRVKKHPELGIHLFWLQGISDEFLEKIYQASTAVVVASVQEGFGLPIIEAAMHGKPLILRDIPVFREIAGENAFYFLGNTPREIRESIVKWMELYEKKSISDSKKISYLTWKESVWNLMEKIGLLPEIEKRKVR